MRFDTSDYRYRSSTERLIVPITGYNADFSTLIVRNLSKMQNNHRSESEHSSLFVDLKYILYFYLKHRMASFWLNFCDLLYLQHSNGGRVSASQAQKSVSSIFDPC